MNVKSVINNGVKYKIMKYIIILYVFSCLYNIIETIRDKEDLEIEVNNVPVTNDITRYIALIVLIIIFIIPIYNFYITYQLIKDARNE